MLIITRNLCLLQTYKVLLLILWLYLSSYETHCCPIIPVDMTCCYDDDDDDSDDIIVISLMPFVGINIV